MNHESKRFTFNVDNLKLVGYLYYPVNIDNPPGVLFIHGSAKTKQDNIFESWQKYLCDKGYSSFSFLTRGVGESEGDFEDSSLLNREKDALKALEAYIESGLVDKAKIAVLANSMGGHVAAKIASDSRIKAVILYAAAAYSQEAEDKKMDQTFTDAIRKPNSWENSPAFKALSQVKKPLFVLYPELDTVIPDGVKKGFKALTEQSNDYIEIPETTHESISEYTDKDKELMIKAFEDSVNFLKNEL